MSTVLKAARELDRRAAPLATAELATEENHPAAIWALGVVLLTVVAAGGMVAGRSRDRQPASPTIPSVPSVAVPVVAVERPIPSIDASAPWGRVEVPIGDARPKPAVSDQTTRSSPQEVEPRRAAAPVPAPRVGAGEPAGVTSTGVPRVEVRAIVFASDPAGRRAVVRIGGGPSVTLHQGESADGVDVQIITEDAVYFRHRGNIFTAGVDR